VSRTEFYSRHSKLLTSLIHFLPVVLKHIKSAIWIFVAVGHSTRPCVYHPDWTCQGVFRGSWEVWNPLDVSVFEWCWEATNVLDLILFFISCFGIWIWRKRNRTKTLFFRLLVPGVFRCPRALRSHSIDFYSVMIFQLLVLRPIVLVLVVYVCTWTFTVSFKVFFCLMTVFGSCTIVWIVGFLWFM
jgi:hypothetical protein